MTDVGSPPPAPAQPAAFFLTDAVREALKMAAEADADGDAKDDADAAPAVPPTPATLDVTASAAADSSSSSSPNTSARPDPSPSDLVLLSVLTRTVVLSRRRPALFLLDGALDPETCSALVAGAGSLEPSGVSRYSKGVHVDKAFRDSEQRALCYGESDAANRALSAMDMFAALAAQLARRLDRGVAGMVSEDPASLIRYGPGQRFGLHYDHGSRDHVNRDLTVIVYLTSEHAPGSRDGSGDGGGGNDGEKKKKEQQRLIGGGTLFPGVRVAKDAKLPRGVDRQPGGRGMLVRSRAGRAVAFFNTLENGGGKRDSASLHAGQRIVQGVKFIATCFYNFE